MPIDIPQGSLIQAHTPNITGAETPKIYDGLDSVMNAAAKGAEINGRVRSAENRLMQMQLNEKNADTVHNLAILRMTQQNDQFQQSLFLKQKENERLQGDSNWKQKKYYDSLKSLGTYASGLSKIDLDDETAWNQAMTLTSENPEGANTGEGRKLLAGVGDQYNKRTAAAKTAAASDFKHLKEEIKLWKWQGFPASAEPLDNPNYWVPATKKKPDGTDDLDAQGHTQIDPDHKTYMIGKNTSGLPVYLTQPTAVVDEYVNRWQRIKSANKKEQVTNPTLNLNPYPVDTTGGGGKMQYGSEAQARAAGHQPGETVSVWDPNRQQYRPWIIGD